MTQLVRYEEARRALEAAATFDEVMAVMNVAERAELYARQASDNQLIERATEIRVRAQRKAGEMLTKAREAGDLQGRGNPQLSEPSTFGLKDIGVTRDQSSRYQQLAAMPDEHFETAVATAKATAGEVTTAFMLREAKKAKPAGKPMKGKKAEALREELKQAQERGVSMLMTYVGLTLRALRATDSVSDQERLALGELADAIAAMAAMEAKP